jgi:hypothetical protein
MRKLSAVLLFGIGKAHAQTTTFAIPNLSNISHEDLLKLLIGVTSALAGWMLAQFTNVVTVWLQRRKVKKLLLAELGDLEKEVNRVQSFYARELQTYGARGIGNSGNAGLSNHIFKNYYKDALLSLTQEQRISYQLIHSMVDQVNIGIQELREMTIEFQKENIADGITPTKLNKAVDLWGGKVKAEYQHCASLLWQIQFHLKCKHYPTLSPNTRHPGEYARHMQKAQEEADKIVEGGKTIDRKKLEQPYSPESYK